MAQNIQSQQSKPQSKPQEKSGEKKEEKPSSRNPAAYKCNIGIPGDSFPIVTYNPFIGLICVILVVTTKSFVSEKYEDITMNEVLLGIVIGYFIGLWYGKSSSTTNTKKK